MYIDICFGGLMLAASYYTSRKSMAHNFGISISRYNYDVNNFCRCLKYSMPW